MSGVSRRSFLKTAGAASVAGALGGAFPLARGAADIRNPERPPNILVFLTDDHRDDILGCAGHPIVQTPVIDGLAEAGVRFRHPFVTTAICAAGRASVLTGLTERTHGYTFGKPPISESHTDTSYPVQLREHGYRTGLTGKFGVGVEGDGRQRMFDFFEPVNRHPYWHEQPDGTFLHETDVCANHAIDFLRDNPEDQPFCLSVSFNAPHAEDGDRRPGVGHFPWPKSAHKYYHTMEMPEPRLNDPEIFESQPDFLKESLNRVRYQWRWDTPEKYQTNMRAYFRMITGIDYAMGRVLDTLEEQGLADNTVVIFTGDNGYYLGERGFAGKWSHYEESLRVPLVIYDPRMPEEARGTVPEGMALNTDLAPTMLELAGIEKPGIYQGRSLLPWMAGEEPEDWRTDFFCEHLFDHDQIPKWEGVRDERYVYARYFEHDYEFLHDLQEDPDQLENFADDPGYADVLEDMRERCDEYIANYEDG
ncbi:MAG: sulfatase-like hydrolase/transferase [Candidatus Hydrogenedentota bacterium]